MGGGYIAAEYGHFFSSMGSKVTIVGRNPQFLPEEEPEISRVVRKELGEAHEDSHEPGGDGGRRDMAREKVVDGAGQVDREDDRDFEVEALMVACGREPISDILHPEKAGIKTDERGWISVNEYLETSQPNVWALGDADGKYLFKHVANYESQVVYYNAVLKQRVKVDYHAVPHAVFTYPEVAAVGMTERQALESARPRGRPDRVLPVREHRQGRGDEREGLLRQGDRRGQHDEDPRART